MKSGMRIATKMSLVTGLYAMALLLGTFVLLARMQAHIEHDQKALSSYTNQMELARVMQVDFKKQVQEWKDILLRGQDAQDFAKYRELFLRQEILVQANARELRQSLKASPARAIVDRFLEAHETLGRNYRAALEVFVEGRMLDHHLADSIVRGQDRSPTDLIDQLVGLIEGDFNHAKESQKAALSTEQRYTAMELGALFLGLLTVSILLTRRITKPIADLTQTVIQVSAQKDYCIRAVCHSRDEVGLLADGFNEMLNQVQIQDAALAHANEARTRSLEREIQENKKQEEELKLAHQRLIEVSRQAGMAEVANNVLHNVGNVLNSVNVSCSVIAGKVRKSRIVTVAKTANLMREHAANLHAFFASDSIGKKLPEFLGKLSVRLAEEQAAVLNELGLLGKNIDHIREIVVMQQNFGNICGVYETLPISSLMEDALHINGTAFTRHGVEVVREYDEVPLVSVNKHRVLQILVNLVRNAKDALGESARSDKRLVARIVRNENCVIMSIEDNGIGIPVENLTRVFAHGFTTKKNGHGFGLHSGVLAAREMGGALSVHSEGSGTGSTFSLELPFGPSLDHVPSSNSLGYYEKSA